MSLLLSLLLLLLLPLLPLALLAGWRWARAWAAFRRMELALPGPPSLPLLGNALLALGLRRDAVLAEGARLYARSRRGNDLWRLGAFGKLFVVVTDPDHIQELFRRKDMLNKARLFYKFFDDVIGEGLLGINGAKWRAHRRAFEPAFHQSLLDRFTEVFSDEGLGFVRRIRPGEAQAVEDNLQTTLTRSFLWTAIAMDRGSDVVDRMLPDIITALEAVSNSFSHRCAQPWLWPSWAFRLSPAGRFIARLSDKINDFCQGVIAGRREKLRQEGATQAADEDCGGPKRRLLLDVLLEPGRNLSLTDIEILHEFKTFTGAAIDTSAATLAWVIKALSLRQDVQERILQELEDVLGKGPVEHVTSQDLSKLVYTECVIKETLRLLPTGPFIAREVREQTEFCGYGLPAGTTLIVNILGAHRDPRHWPEPRRFDPERFLPERSQGRHPCAFLPFSAGPRNCIGMRYAMMSMKTLLATLVPRYRIDAVDDGHTDPSRFPLTLGIATRMRGGVRVVFTPREGCAGCAA